MYSAKQYALVSQRNYRGAFYVHGSTTNKLISIRWEIPPRTTKVCINKKYFSAAARAFAFGRSFACHHLIVFMIIKSM
jgi:hypothetical protein